MPIFEVSQETLDSLPDEIKTSLQAYEPEDTSGLKNKANELLSEKKKADAKAAELEAQLAATIAKQKAHKVDNADEGKLADAMAKLESERQLRVDLENKINDGKLDSAAAKIASELAPTDPRRAALIAKEVKGRLQLDGDSITVLSKDGVPTISSLDDLTSETRKDYDFLVDGTKASGGDALGGKGRASSKPFNELNATERAQFANKNPKEYAQHMRAT